MTRMQKTPEASRVDGETTVRELLEIIAAHGCVLVLQLPKGGQRYAPLVVVTRPHHIVDALEERT